ncbi:MAG: hypothetical protein HS108_03995 [Planctomycetes bacterium]|nr:hypothetical protein [Planctomycetota bacterium]MCL4729168.1 hypothetical protein [Planctomycetota bacterium]
MTPRALLVFPLLSLLVLCASLRPVAAQTPPAEDARTAELRRWFDSLTPQRQELLKRRLKVLKRLPREAQTELLKNVAEGRPMLTDKQRENLEQVRKLPYLERVRLYTVSRELDMLRRANPAAFKRANERPDRARALYEMLLIQRGQMALTPEERERAKTMRPEERMRLVRERLAEDGRERLERISFLDPRVADLRRAAAAGDETARAELRQAMADLGTLDMLLQRLSPERRQKTLEELRGLGLEKAVELVRRELRSQWNEQERKRPDRERPLPDNGARPAERKGLLPKDDRPRDK